TGGGEMQIAETSGGRLLATIRNNTFAEKGVRFFNTSPDGGETWGTPFFQTPAQAPLPDPKCQASLLRLDSMSHAARPLLALANAADPASRSNLTVRLSPDQGQTWPKSTVLYPGSAAYSALTLLPSGDLGILMELDRYGRICFQRLSRKDL